MNDPVRSKENFLVFGSPQICEAEIEEVTASMRTGWLGTGPKVARFEKEFATYRSLPRSLPIGLAVNSCTAALHLSVLALDLEPGDEVITTPLTFCATVNAIIHAGAVPVLADVDPTTMNLNPERVREKIGPKTRAILPVHFAGRPCEMDPLTQLAGEHGLEIIEDCAHAIEAEYKGTPCGAFGRFGCFSFYVTKNMVTGEGGMILTSDETAAARIKVLALHGMSSDAWKRFSDEGYKHYLVTEAGFKYNMMDLQAAIGLHQLDRVEQNLARREEIWARYDDELKDLPLILPAPPETGTRHARHLYTVLVEEPASGLSRDEFLTRMHGQNIGTGVHYLSVPEHPYYQSRFGWRPEETPEATRIGRLTVSLPLSAKLTDQDVEDVVEAVKRTLS